MATTNDITICNSALTKIGADNILSLDDGTVAADLCKLRYPLVLDYVTSMHPWRISRERVVLGPSATAPTFGYTKQFELPADFLGHFVVSDDANNIFSGDMDPATDYNIEGGKLMANFDTCYLIYIRKLLPADMAKILPTFAEAVSYYLAMDLVMAITQSDSSKEMLLAQFERALKKAKAMDARGDSPRALEALEFLQSRVQGHYDFVFKFTT